MRRPYFLVLLLLAFASCGAEHKPAEPQVEGPAAQRLFQPNRMALIVRNDGSRDFTAGETLTYDGRNVINDLGLWIGARVAGQIRVSATSYYGSELEPARLGASDSLALVYVLSPGAKPGDPDYDAWPVRAGAPSNFAGRPLLIGSGTGWTAYDDFDPGLHVRFGSHPLGAVVRETVWGFPQPDSALFARYQVQNASDSRWDEVLVGVWVDADVGDPENELVGCDIERSLGYAYTAPGVPETGFGTFQPAMGVLLLATPEDAGFYAFPRIWKAENEPHSAAEAYNLLQGRNLDGSAYQDSTTGQVTRFTASGDPVAGTGSIEHVPADRRMLVVAGPVSVEPEAVISLTCAILFGRDPDALRAITRLWSAADSVRSERTLWDFGTSAAGPP
jgi:hypothetical protein